MADWWLQKNPGFKTLDEGRGWMKGFCDSLKKSKLHPLNWEHLDELVTWHKKQGNDGENNTEFVEGSSTQAM